MNPIESSETKSRHPLFTELIRMLNIENEKRLQRVKNQEIKEGKSYSDFIHAPFLSTSFKNYHGVQLHLDGSAINSVTFLSFSDGKIKETFHSTLCIHAGKKTGEELEQLLQEYEEYSNVPDECELSVHIEESISGKTLEEFLEKLVDTIKKYVPCSECHTPTKFPILDLCFKCAMQQLCSPNGATECHICRNLTKVQKLTCCGQVLCTGCKQNLNKCPYCMAELEKR